jgi:hypothetical protein
MNDDFHERLTALRAARVADLDLVAELSQQVESLEARVRDLEAWARRRHAEEKREAESPQTSVTPARGLFCAFCAKPLDARGQRLFCSKRCSNAWHHQHGWRATPSPKISRNGDRFQSTIVAGEGERR